MDNYVYIISSLPSIIRGTSTGFNPETVLCFIKEQLSKKDLDLFDLMQKGLEGSELDVEFYRSTASCKNSFIKGYFHFDRIVRNEKARYISETIGRPAEQDTVILEEEEDEYDESQHIREVLRMDDILARERGLDEIMWDKIDSLTELKYFSLDVILGFAAKLKIVRRWEMLDENTGRDLFRRLVEDIRGTFKGVEFESK